jgi:hypothetical protein
MHMTGHFSLFFGNKISVSCAVIHGQLKRFSELAKEKIERSKIFMQIPSDRIGFLKGGIFFVLEQWNNEGCQTAVRDVIVANNASVE